MLKPRPFTLASAFLVIASAFFAPSALARETARVVQREDAAPCVTFGIEDLKVAVASRGGGDEISTILVESLDQPAIDARRAPFESAVPAAAESFVVRRSGEHLLVLGRDPVGAMYGALEVAELVRNTGSLAGIPD